MADATPTIIIRHYTPEDEAASEDITYRTGFLGGALWALVPAILKARWHVDEVITSLMMVYIASNLIVLAGDLLAHYRIRVKRRKGGA